MNTTPIKTKTADGKTRRIGFHRSLFWGDPNGNLRFWGVRYSNPGSSAHRRQETPCNKTRDEAVESAKFLAEQGAERVIIIINGCA